MANHPHFEAVKVALKQDKTGFVLTLCIHPDELDDRILRDFVGARYQVVMVRLNGDDRPIDRQNEFSGDRATKVAGVLCRSPEFWNYLLDQGLIEHGSDIEATNWLRSQLGVRSRAELKTNHEARIRLDSINTEFLKWRKG